MSEQVLYRTPLVDKTTGLLSREWIRFFQELSTGVSTVNNYITTNINQGQAGNFPDDTGGCDISGDLLFTAFSQLAIDSPRLEQPKVDPASLMHDNPRSLPSIDVASLMHDNPQNTNCLWQSWTPTVTGSGSMTISGLTVAFARYLQLGSIVFFTLNISCTTGGTAGQDIQISFPINSSIVTDAIAISGNGVPAGGSLQSLVSFASYGAQQFLARIVANWPAGAQTAIRLSGFYQL